MGQPKVMRQPHCRAGAIAELGYYLVSFFEDRTNTDRIVVVTAVERQLLLLTFSDGLMTSNPLVGNLRGTSSRVEVGHLGEAVENLVMRSLERQRSGR